MFRFRLRLLLIVTTFACLPFALVGNRVAFTIVLVGMVIVDSCDLIQRSQNKTGLVYFLKSRSLKLGK